MLNFQLMFKVCYQTRNYETKYSDYISLCECNKVVTDILARLSFFDDLENTIYNIQFKI